VNDAKIAVRVTVMNKVQFLMASEPRKSLKPRSLDVIFLVEKDVRVKRHRAGADHHHKEIQRQQEISAPADEKYRNKKIRRRVAFVAEIGVRNKMSAGIMGVMEVDVVTKKLTAHGMVRYFIMYQRLAKRHDQMRSNGGYEK